ncbi:MAG: hypothetical protein WBB79_01895 [Candidatus Macondimonas sp.]
MQANGGGRPQDHGDEPTLSALLGILVALTALRIALLAASPLDLFVDEAQYWLWSTTPDFGYYSKPPVIAWVIAPPPPWPGMGNGGCGWHRPCCMAARQASSSSPAGHCTARAWAWGRRCCMPACRR